MTQSPSRFARACFETIPIFHGTAEGCVIDLSDNTNLWGAPPCRPRVARGARRRARPLSIRLQQRAHRRAGFIPRGFSYTVTVGCGSDDVLDAALRAFGTGATCSPCPSHSNRLKLN